MRVIQESQQHFFVTQLFRMQFLQCAMLVPRECNHQRIAHLTPPLGRWCEPCQNHPPRGTVTVPNKTCSQTAMQHDLLHTLLNPCNIAFRDIMSYALMPSTDNIVRIGGSTSESACNTCDLPSLPWHTETELRCHAALRPSIVETLPARN